MKAWPFFLAFGILNLGFFAYYTDDHDDAVRTAGVMMATLRICPHCRHPLGPFATPESCGYAPIRSVA